MPNEQTHLQIARRNQALIDHLLSLEDTFPEWIVIVAFYKALHLVDALFDRHLQKDGQSHKNRDRILKTTKRYAHIFRHYSPLRHASELARYASHLSDDSPGYNTYKDYLSLELVKSEILGHRLAQIEKTVTKLLARKK